jgi:hypothetical protein
MSRTDRVLRSSSELHTKRRRNEMPRYLLVVNFEGGVIETPMEE